jgi:polyferredoxin
MGIDIRKGYQVECINCGRCLDACRQVMAKRNQSGLISYNFGTKGEGPRALLNLRTLLLSLATVALAGTLIIAVYQRPTASLKVSVSHEVASRALKDGNLATFFNAWVNNRSREKTIYNIVARQAETGRPLILKGQTDHLQLAAGENLRIDFVLVTPVPDSRLNVEFILSDIVGTKVAVATAYIKEQDKY